MDGQTEERQTQGTETDVADVSVERHVVPGQVILDVCVVTKILFPESD